MALLLIVIFHLQKGRKMLRRENQLVRALGWGPIMMLLKLQMGLTGTECKPIPTKDLRHNGGGWT